MTEKKQRAAGRGGASSPRAASLGLFGVVDENTILLVVSAHLTSAEASRLRSASQSCASVFIRNAPCPGGAYVFFEALEALEEPDLEWSLERGDGIENDDGDGIENDDGDGIENDDGRDRPKFWPKFWSCSLTEVPRRNRFSPLRVFRLDAIDAWRLLYFESQRPFALSLWRHKAFVLAAVAQNGKTLFFADESLKRDRDVVLAAVKQYGTWLRVADESLRSDRDVVLTAVTQDGYALQYAGENLKSDRDVVLAAVTSEGFGGPTVLKFAHENLRVDDELVAAASQNPRAGLYFRA